MKLTVLGATGGTGLEIIRQAIARGHSVTALARAPEPLKKFGDGITLFTGDPLSESQLEQGLRGSDAVLSAFGPHTNATRIWPQFAHALTAAMSRTGVTRLVALSTAFLFRDNIIPPTFLLGNLLFHDVVTGAIAMEKVFTNSSLAWTLVRPPRLTDSPATGRYRIEDGHLPRFGFTISRADVADFMLRATENNSGVGRIAGVCN